MVEVFDEASTYDRNSDEQRQGGINLMNLLSLERGFKVLDLGCGTGYLTKELASRVGPEGKVLGIDPDRERIKLAKEKYSVPNVAYQEGTAEHIPGDGYDVVFSNYVLQWCPDKDKVFKEVSKSLKEGGKFGFVVVTDTAPSEFFCTPGDMQTLECRQLIINKISVPGTDEIRKLCSDNGFKTICMLGQVRTTRLRDASELIKFYMTHFHELGREHYNLKAMKRHYGEGEIVRDIATLYHSCTCEVEYNEVTIVTIESLSQVSRCNKYLNSIRM